MIVPPQSLLFAVKWLSTSRKIDDIQWRDDDDNQNNFEPQFWENFQYLHPVGATHDQHHHKWAITMLSLLKTRSCYYQRTNRGLLRQTALERSQGMISVKCYQKNLALSAFSSLVPTRSWTANQAHHHCHLCQGWIPEQAQQHELNQKEGIPN